MKNIVEKPVNVDINVTETPKAKAKSKVVKAKSVKVGGMANRGPGRPRTKVTLKRVVLLDGTPVGRGRPTENNKATRTVVFIPVDQTFNLDVHGLGVVYRAGLSQFKTTTKRMDIAKFNKLVNLPATSPVATPVAVAPVTSPAPLAVD